MSDLHRMATAARESFYTLSVSAAERRNSVLRILAQDLRTEKEKIFEANRADLEQARKEDFAPPLLHRLTFGEEKLNQVCLSLISLSSLPDPLGMTSLSTEITEGLQLY